MSQIDDILKGIEDLESDRATRGLERVAEENRFVSPAERRRQQRAQRVAQQTSSFVSPAERRAQRRKEVVPTEVDEKTERTLLRGGRGGFITLETLKAEMDSRIGTQLIEGSKDVVRNTLNSMKAVAESDPMYYTNEEKAIQQQMIDQGYLKPMENEGKLAAGLQSMVDSDALRADEEAMQNMTFSEQLFRQLPQVGAQVATSLLTGGAGSTMMMGSQIVGSTYAQLRDQGVDHNRAFGYSVLNAVIQAPMEAIGIGKAAKYLKVRNLIQKRVRRMMESGLTEAITEFAQEYPDAWVNLVAKNPDINKLNAMKDVLFDGETLVNALRSGTIGGIIGGGLGAARSTRKPRGEQYVPDDPAAEEVAALELVESIEAQNRLEQQKAAKAAKRLARKKAKAAAKPLAPVEPKFKTPKPKEDTPSEQPATSTSKETTEGTKGTTGKAGDRFGVQLEPTTTDAPTTETKTQEPAKTDTKQKAGGRFGAQVEPQTQEKPKTEEQVDVPDFKNQVDAVAWAKENTDKLGDIQAKLKLVEAQYEQETDPEKKMELAYHRDSLRHAEAIAEGKGTLYDQIQKRDAEKAAEKERQDRQTKVEEISKKSQQEDADAFKELGLDPNKAVITGGGSLRANQVIDRDGNDIDVLVSDEYYDELKKSGKFEDRGYKLKHKSKTGKDVEIWKEIAGGRKYDAMSKTAVVRGDRQYLSVQDRYDNLLDHYKESGKDIDPKHKADFTAMEQTLGIEQTAERTLTLHRKKEQTAATLAKKKAEAEAAYKAKLKAGENVEVDKKPAAKDLATTGLLTENGELITGDLDIEGLSPSQFSSTQAEDLLNSFNEIKKKWPNHWKKAKKVLVTKDGRYMPLGKYLVKAKLLEKVQKKQEGPDTTNRVKDKLKSNQKQINDLFRKEEVLPLTDKERADIDAMLKKGSAWDKKLDTVASMLGDDVDQVRDYKAAAQLALTEHVAAGKDIDKFNPMLSAKTLYNKQYRGEGLGSAARGVRTGKLKGKAEEDMADVERANPMAPGTKQVKSRTKTDDLDEGNVGDMQESIESDAEYNRQQEVLDIIQNVNRKKKRNPDYKPTRAEILAQRELDTFVKTKKASKQTLMQKRDMDLIRDERARQEQEQKLVDEFKQKIKDDSGWQDMLGKVIEIEQVGEFDPNNPSALKLIYKVIPKAESAFKEEHSTFFKRKQADVQKMVQQAIMEKAKIGGSVKVKIQLEGRNTLDHTIDSDMIDVSHLTDSPRVKRLKAGKTRKEIFEEGHDSNFYVKMPVAQKWNAEEGEHDTVWGWVKKPDTSATTATVDIPKGGKELALYKAGQARLQEAMQYAEDAKRERKFWVDKKAAPMAKRAWKKREQKAIERSLKAREKAQEFFKQQELLRKQRLVAEFVKAESDKLKKQQAQQTKVDEDLELQQLLDLDITTLQNMLRVSNDKKILSKVAKAIRIKRKTLPPKQTVINRTKGTRKEVGQTAAQQPTEQTTAQKALAKSKAKAAPKVSKAGDRFAPMGMTVETKTEKTTEVVEPKAEVVAPKGNRFSPEISSSYKGIVPGAGKKPASAVKVEEDMSTAAEQAAADNIAEAETILPKAKKPKAGGRFGAVINNEKGGAELQLPGRDDLIKVPNRVTQKWVDAYDKVAAKIGKMITSVARSSSAVDSLLTNTVSKFGTDVDFRDMQQYMKLNIHRATVLGAGLKRAIDVMSSNFGSKDATNHQFDAMTQTLNRLTTGAINPVHKPRSAKSAKRMEKALEKRKAQVAQGSITMFPNQYEAVHKANKQFEILEKELTSRGLLADHQFRQLNRKERAKAINRVRELDGYILKAQESARTEADKKKLIKQYEKEQRKLLTRLQIHYKNSGVNYLRHIRDEIEQTERYRKRLKKDALTKGYSKRRKNWIISTSKTDGRLVVKRKKSADLKKVGDLVRKGISQESHDMHMWDLFENIAKHDDTGGAIVVGDQTIPWASEHAEDFLDKGITPKRVPKNEAFGPLAGMYVEPHIYKDMSESFEEIAEWRRTVRKVFSTWKAGKTVYNPATVTRNFMSNIALANIVGGVNVLNPKTYQRYLAISKDIIRIKKGLAPKTEFGKEIMRDTTIMSQSFVRSEFGSGDFIQQGLEKLADVSPMKGMANVMRMMSKAPEVYDFLETSMKALVYIDARMKGQDSVSAAKLSEEALFDYGDVPPAIRWARLYYSPFITFTYKALPAIAKAHVRTPWRLIPYYAGILAAEQLADYMLGDDEEEAERKRRLLPDYASRDMVPGVLPSHVRMPFQTKSGRDKYWDLSYILPWGDMSKFEEGPLRYVPSFLAPSNPMVTVPAMFLANEDLFTHKEIVADIDDGGELLLKVAEQAWNETAPALLSTHKMRKLTSALYGDKNKYGTGEKYSMADATLDILFGIKFRNIDYLEQTFYHNTDLQKKAVDIQNKYSKRLENMYHMQSNRYSDEERERKTEKVHQDMMEDMNDLYEETMYRFMMDNDEGKYE